MRRKFPRASLLVLMVCLATLTACSTQITGTAHPAVLGQAGKGSTPLEAPLARDAAAVTSALRKIDACGLFDLELAKAKNSTNMTLLAKGPHTCMLVPSKDYEVTDTVLGVTVGKFSDHFDRYRGAIITLKGAKAYEFLDPTYNGCRVVIPVSFNRAIEFDYEQKNTDTCGIVRSYAEVAIDKLRNPDAITVDTTKRPFSSWDGCTFLAQMLGESAQNYHYKPDGTEDPFSSCDTTPQDVRNHETTPSIEIYYDQEPKPTKEVRQLSGKSVEFTALSSTCQTQWAQGPSGNQNKWYSTLVFEITAGNCEVASQLTEKAIALAGQQPSDIPTPPQRPLLYQPEENDTGQIGACVDFGASNYQGCVPAIDVPLPSSPQEILQYSSNNTTCTLFREAIQAVFGPSFQPISWEQRCFFVEPTHTVEIGVGVGSTPPASYRVSSDAREEQIAGKAAIILGSEYFLSPSNNVQQPGYLNIGVKAQDGRGKEIGTSDAKLDQQKITQQIEQTFTAVLQKYFP